MFAPQYHIAISNTGPELTPQALKAVYDLGKKRRRLISCSSRGVTAAG